MTLLFIYFYAILLGGIEVIFIYDKRITAAEMPQKDELCQQKLLNCYLKAESGIAVKVQRASGRRSLRVPTFQPMGSITLVHLSRKNSS